MAHGDYDCCAICDSKQGYSNDSETKEEICSYCVAGMAENGIIVRNVNALISWMGSENPEKVREILGKVGFRKCFYHNRVDDAYPNKPAPAKEK